MKRALIVSGGLGTRLRPLTHVIPKPLLPLGRMTMLEHHVAALTRAGFDIVYISVHYLPELFRAVIAGFESKYATQIEVIEETTPGGTFGTAVQLCRRSRQAHDETPLLVINADIVSDIDLRRFYNQGRSTCSIMLIAVNQYNYHVPYGVVTASHDSVLTLEEKPKLQMSVLAGVYYVSPQLAGCSLSTSESFGVDDVITTLLRDGVTVNLYRHQGEWIDAGTLEDLARAQQVVEQAL